MELRAYLDENFRFTERYLKEHLPEAGFRISESTYLACPRATLEEGLCRICEAANTKHTYGKIYWRTAATVMEHNGCRGRRNDPAPAAALHPG